MKNIVIAIDGPAASGKSTVARALAQRVGYVYVNSGAMYRAVTWYLLSHEIDPLEPATVVAQLRSMDFQAALEEDTSSITIDGIDPTPFLCEDAVNRSVSAVSSIPEVRRVLVEKQRSYSVDSNVVMEGRDIGSVVFPDTPYKFYIDASLEVRARRRTAQGQSDEISARDRFDSSRRSSPLVIAEDAHVIDSSNLTIDGVVGEIIGRLKLKGMPVS